MLAYCDKGQYLLDEPTAGVDVQYRHLIWGLIKDARARGRSIVVSSHLLDEIASNVDYFYFIQKGSAERFQSMKDFLDSYESNSPDEAFIKATVGL
ncbi:daunorubicin resistance ABC transporter, ATP-binding protein [compost metagenome]